LHLTMNADLPEPDGFHLDPTTTNPLSEHEETELACDDDPES